MPEDQELLDWAMQARADVWYVPIMLVTFVSSSIPALLITLAVSAIEIRRLRRRPGAAERGERWWAGFWPTLVYLGAVATNILLRVSIARLPPSVSAITAVLPEVRVDFQRYAFPSGHAGAAVIAFLSLAIVLWNRRSWRWVAVGAAAVVVLGTGFGRPYLGVHWPTDVLGGYLLAGFWLSIGVILRKQFCLTQEHDDRIIP